MTPRPNATSSPFAGLVAPLVAILVGAAACSSPEVSGRGPSPERGGGSGGGGMGGPSGGGSSADGPVVVLPEAGVNPAPPPVGPGDRCAEDSHQAEQIPVDLLLLVDTSRSMTFLGGNRSKWSRAIEGLSSFLKDPRSAGLGVGVQYFPTLPPAKECTAEAQCPPAGIFSERCVQQTSCGVAGALLPNDALECDPDGVEGCPAGQVCLPVGRCSVSGARCLGVGQPCPGGKAGDSCTTAPRVCALPSGSWCEQPFDRPAVPIAPLPANEPALTRSLGSVIPLGGTPLGPAVRGALGHLRGHLMANPGRRGALVLVSDGLPDSFCSGNFIGQIVPPVQMAAAAMPAIPTYVIGVFAEDEVARARPALEQMATAGGTGMPYILAAMDDLSMRLQEALNQIRGTAVACEFTIPAPAAGGMIDYGKVNVRTRAGGVDQDLLYVGNVGRCDPARGGWYFDLDPATGARPGRVLLCPSSCSGIKAAAGSRVEVGYGCKTRSID